MGDRNVWIHSLFGIGSDLLRERPLDMSSPHLLHNGYRHDFHGLDTVGTGQSASQVGSPNNLLKIAAGRMENILSH